MKRRIVVSFIVENQSDFDDAINGLDLYEKLKIEKAPKEWTKEE